MLNFNVAWRLLTVAEHHRQRQAEAEKANTFWFRRTKLYGWQISVFRGPCWAKNIENNKKKCHKKCINYNFAIFSNCMLVFVPFNKGINKPFVSEDSMWDLNASNNRNFILFQLWQQTYSKKIVQTLQTYFYPPPNKCETYFYWSKNVPSLCCQTNRPRMHWGDCGTFKPQVYSNFMSISCFNFVCVALRSGFMC